MNWSEIEADLKVKLSEERFRHTLNVVEMARILADRFSCNVKQASLAALLHDAAKHYSDAQLLEFAEQYHIALAPVTRLAPQLLHGPVAAFIATELYGVNDEAVKRAIYYHTTGAETMSTLDKVVFLADCIEKDRFFPGIEAIREKALSDLDGATAMALDKIIGQVVERGNLLHNRTIEARNALIINKITNKKGA